MEEGDKIFTVHNKEETERRIAQCNEEHFRKLKSTSAHKDKTCKVMNENKTRDAMMNEELNRDECDEKEVCPFLKLLKELKG